MSRSSDVGVDLDGASVIDVFERRSAKPSRWSVSGPAQLSLCVRHQLADGLSLRQRGTGTDFVNPSRDRTRLAATIAQQPPKRSVPGRGAGTRRYFEQVVWLVTPSPFGSFLIRKRSLLPLVMVQMQPGFRIVRLASLASASLWEQKSSGRRSG